GGGSTTSGKKMHIHGGTSIGTGYSGSTVATNGLGVEGSVGIGIANPTVKLQVAGGGAIIGTTGSGSNNRTLTVLGDNTTQISFGSYPYDWSPAIQIQNNDNTKMTWISAGGSGAYSSSNARYLTNGSGLDFYTGSNAFAATITSSATMGIGVSTPASTLHSAGAIRTGIPAGGLGGASASNGALVFNNASNSNTVTLQTSATSSSYTLNLPTGQGGANAVLVNDGSGNLSWGTHYHPWENMGTNVQQVCAGGSAATDYEWGVTYNNSSPILRVTCNGWNSGQRVCTYPPYPTGDSEPFTWGGACWIWGTASTWDDACPIAAHSYYGQDANGRYNMTGGNGCSNLPTVYRRRL
ncbi:MAG TPA: hypothetical protein VK154_15450, partial [Chitinophagales bacterium]|nr:hypothetical protein [Chitinophagales bacterium]